MKVKPADERSRANEANEPLGPQSFQGRYPLSGPIRFKAWRGDLFSAAVTVATFGVRLALGGHLKDRPILILRTLPITLAAFVGGMRGHLLATAISYFGASYDLLPPFHTLRVASPLDRWNLFFLMLVGVVISVLNDALHRARRKAPIANGALQARAALVKAEEALLKAGALQKAIFNSANFSCIATDAKGVIVADCSQGGVG
jgi:K+-sensing histidine kinase KdpD